MDHDDPLIPIDPDLDPSDPAAPTVTPVRSRSSRHRHRTRPAVLAAIGLGGMIGATARYGVARWVPTSPGRFPWATFWTNVTGSFVLGLLLVTFIQRFPQIGRAQASAASDPLDRTAHPPEPARPADPGPDSGRSTPQGDQQRPETACPAVTEAVSGRSSPHGDRHRPESTLPTLLRPFVATGILGAFTTMSTYQVETALLLEDGHGFTAGLYLGASLAAGLGLAYAGILTGRRFPQRTAAPR